MNTFLPAFILSLILSATSFASNDSVDMEALRKAYQANVESKQLSHYLKDIESVNKAVLDLEEVDPVNYDLPEYLNFHTLACQWLKGLSVDKLSSLAETLRAKTKIGDAISGQERSERLKSKIFGKSANKLLGKGFVNAITEVAVAGDQGYGWPSALLLYESAIENSKTQEVFPIFMSYKMSSKGSTIKFTDYVIRLSARYIQLCLTFVKGKMDLFDDIQKQQNQPTLNNNNI